MGGAAFLGPSGSRLKLPGGSEDPCRCLADYSSGLRFSIPASVEHEPAKDYNPCHSVLIGDCPQPSNASGFASASFQGISHETNESTRRGCIPGIGGELC